MTFSEAAFEMLSQWGESARPLHAILEGPSVLLDLRRVTVRVVGPVSLIVGSDEIDLSWHFLGSELILDDSKTVLMRSAKGEVCTLYG